MTFTLIGSLVNLITAVMTTVGLPGLFALMIVESFGVPPIPSEVILPFAGFLVAGGTFSLGGAMAAALAGTVVGSFCAYAVGRWWRHRILGLGVGRLRLQPRHLERVDRYFARHGPVVVGVARLLPVLRSYVSYPAGTARMNPVWFGAYTLLGAVPFTLALVYAGMLLRSNWDLVSTWFQPLDIALVVLVILVVVFFLLQIAGYLEPGWPPRRSRPASGSTPDPTRSTGTPPPSA